MNNLVEASSLLFEFRGESFRDRVKRLEEVFSGASQDTLEERLSKQNLNTDLLSAALLIKHNSSQINEIIHTIGILLALQSILGAGEKIESMSLASGNTGKGFDLETTERIAEFTFIEWQGGPEVIRQNKVFKDFYFLAEATTHKKRELYTIGTDCVFAFFNSGRALLPILKGNAKLGNDFLRRYDGKYETVRDYYNSKRNIVTIHDVRKHLPCLDV